MLVLGYAQNILKAKIKKLIHPTDTWFSSLMILLSAHFYNLTSTS